MGWPRAGRRHHAGTEDSGFVQTQRNFCAEQDKTGKALGQNLSDVECQLEFSILNQVSMHVLVTVFIFL